MKAEINNQNKANRMMEMTQEWIDQYNKKCAEFLGKTYKKNMIVLPYKHVSNSNTTGEIWQHCKYHSDWNWIMEVVEKIESIKQLTLETCNNWVGEFTIVIRYKSYSSTHYFSREIPRVSHGQDFRTKKEAVIQAIDQFIDWYSKQKEL